MAEDKKDIATTENEGKDPAVTEEKQRISRREMLKKSYSTALIGLLFGTGAVMKATGCYEDYYDDYYSNYYSNSYYNTYDDHYNFYSNYSNYSAS